ncbi:MAG: hypothetical protein ACM31C_25265 [Acidobacteriota bacterium]
MRLALVLVAAMTAVAHAQAPGQVAPEPASLVMARPWSVSLSLAAMSAKPHVDGVNAVGLGAFELAGAYRLRPSIQLGLSLAGGGGENNTLSTGALWANVRYRFMAEQPWNVLALGSLGVASVYGKDAPDVERKARGAIRIGGGVEHRWQSWAIEADLVVFAIAQNDQVPPPPAPTTEYDVARFGLTGIALSFGGTFYW